MTVPDCSLSWATGGRVVTVCPFGDSDTLRIIFYAGDAFGNPRPGIPADSICIECPGVSPRICADAPTDSAGNTTITYAAGGINPSGWCDQIGITLHDGASTCVLDVGTRPTLRFFDLNAGGLVGPTDFGVFGLCWLSSAVVCQKVNFDNGVAPPLVGPVDFAIFGLHWLDGSGT